MTDKKFKELIEEAKAALRNYPEVDGFSLATESEVWSTLTPKQKMLVKRALMPCGEIGNHNSQIMCQKR